MNTKARIVIRAILLLIVCPACLVLGTICIVNTGEFIYLNIYAVGYLALFADDIIVMTYPDNKNEQVHVLNFILAMVFFVLANTLHGVIKP